MDQDTINENRRKYIRELRENPRNLTQYFGGSLYDSPSNVCALGLGCYTFDIEMNTKTAYMDLTEILGLSKDLEKEENSIDFIWAMNDRYKMSFSEISEKLEQVWFGEND